MNMNLVHSLCVFIACALTIAGAVPAHKRKVRRNNHAKLLHDFGVYKQKLQENGVINSIDQQVYVTAGATDTTTTITTTDSNHRTTELAMLQLMPVLIEELRLGRIEPTDQSMLHSLFGKLWDAMVDEAKAADGSSSDDDDGGDLVLVGILRALQELEASGRLQTVIESNAVPVTDVRFANLWHRNAGDSEEPSQRILKLAAVLMQAHVETERKA